MRRPPRPPVPALQIGLVLLPVLLLLLAARGAAQPRAATGGAAQPGVVGGRAAPEAGSATQADRIGGGELRIVPREGEAPGVCPLKHTDVTADIAGFIARTTVQQVFHNPTDRKIEAVYVFPLPQNAAVDGMTMLVGERRVVGEIREREEARQIYEAARQAGYVAGLLDQERPNIFTQSVANIEPGVEVRIEISFVETLKFDDGQFTWSFPMVVGPRYIPGGGSAPAPMTKGTDTPEVPDASRITPPVTPQGTRAGHDISLRVTLDAGLSLSELKSELHDVDVVREGDERAVITLAEQAEIPNRDFVLKYRVGTDEVGDGLLAHTDERGTFFTLVLQPPGRVAPAQVVPRELVFVLDTSGSMQGFPIEQAKKTMNRIIDGMRPSDAFNVITFSGDTRVLWDKPRPASAKNIQLAHDLLNAHGGAGGTEMMKAINAALVQAERVPVRAGGPAPMRVVCFMTDGYVGNDMEIIDAVRRNAGTTRVFSFGIGNSVNRFLLDGMAEAGRGEAEYVFADTGSSELGASRADEASARFHERLDAPVLTDIALDWGDLPVSEVYPALIPDLWSVKPVLVHGRLSGPASGVITLHGVTGAGPFERQVALEIDGTEKHDALASLWARTKVDDLMNRDLGAMQRGEFPDELKQAVLALGLEYRLMTQFTSFVAVEEIVVTPGGPPVRIDVPVEMPEGVSYEGVFGEQGGGGGGRGIALYNMRGPAYRARMAGKAAAGGPAVPAAGAPPMLARAMRRAEDKDEEWAQGGSLPPEARLAPALIGLAERVEKEGTNGDLTLDKLVVKNYRLDVIITLRDLSQETLEVLKALGFEQRATATAGTLVIGSIDVRKLEELIKLEAVLGVRPVSAP